MTSGATKTLSKTLSLSLQTTSCKNSHDVFPFSPAFYCSEQIMFLKTFDEPIATVPVDEKVLTEQFPC